MSFDRILIANRGEIAVRIIKTARRMGLSTVAVYSDADCGADHMKAADMAVHIGPSEAAQSYLNMDKIIEVAKATGAGAIHPGYGFLSENAAFSQLCEKNNIIFIGPDAEAINAMGLKDKAKDIMEKAGVPVVPGYQGDDQSASFLKQQAAKIGYPVLIKAVAGGGGKGMRLVQDDKEFEAALESCKREAKKSFANDHVLIEKFIQNPRHIEVQVFADTHGNVVHLFERDCSLQRRHQKVVEEAPAPNMPEEVREAMGQAAVQAAKAIHYRGAGTIEFIADASNGLKKDSFYFMEMNTRLQVEHPVTEMITGQDLVEWQIRVARGEFLPNTQDELSIKGHAVEVRLYAEDPSQNFMPQTGLVEAFICDADDVRIDSGVSEGSEVTIFYDPMIAKLITHGEDRKAALSKMEKSLEALYLKGLEHNGSFLHALITHDAFKAAALDTSFIETHSDSISAHMKADELEDVFKALYVSKNKLVTVEGSSDPWDLADDWRAYGTSQRKYSLTDQQNNDVEFYAHSQSNMITIVTDSGHKQFWVEQDAIIHQQQGVVSVSMTDQKTHQKYKALLSTKSNRNGDALIVVNGRQRILKPAVYSLGEEGDLSGTIKAPMPGRVLSLLVKNGEAVTKDQPLCIMEAMKMEVTIKASTDGIVEGLSVASGDQVEDGAVLMVVADPDTQSKAA